MVEGSLWQHRDWLELRIWTGATNHLQSANEFTDARGSIGSMGPRATLEQHVLFSYVFLLFYCFFRHILLTVTHFPMVLSLLYYIHTYCSQNRVQTVEKDVKIGTISAKINQQNRKTHEKSQNNRCEHKTIRII